MCTVTLCAVALVVAGALKVNEAPGPICVMVAPEGINVPVTESPKEYPAVDAGKRLSIVGEGGTVQEMLPLFVSGATAERLMIWREVALM